MEESRLRVRIHSVVSKNLCPNNSLITSKEWSTRLATRDSVQFGVRSRIRATTSQDSCLLLHQTPHRCLTQALSLQLSTEVIWWCPMTKCSIPPWLIRLHPCSSLWMEFLQGRQARDNTTSQMPWISPLTSMSMAVTFASKWTRCQLSSSRRISRCSLYRTIQIRLIQVI